jgi:hypothetical protein
VGLRPPCISPILNRLPWWSLQARKYEREAAREIINAADVVCATCVTAGGELLAACHFSHVLVDEATQSTESATLIPIVRGCHTLVLIGDQQQLPPTIKSFKATMAGLGRRCSPKAHPGGALSPSPSQPPYVGFAASTTHGQLSAAKAARPQPHALTPPSLTF